MGRYFSEKPNFEEETYGVHPQQNTVDIILTGLFLIVVGLFLVPHSIFALQRGLAWFLGLAGTVITVYFDHYYPSVLAAEKFKKNPRDSAAEKYSNQKYYSTRLYLALIFFMLLLLVVGSIPTWGVSLSATAVLGLDMTAKIGAVSLAVINVARSINTMLPVVFNKTLGFLKSMVCCFSRSQIPNQNDGLRLDFSPRTSLTSTASISRKFSEEFVSAVVARTGQGNRPTEKDLTDDEGIFHFSPPSPTFVPGLIVHNKTHSIEYRQRSREVFAPHRATSRI